MRIVGGMWRGRSFEAPEGRGTRPTTDRMRESIASMVLSACDLSIEDRSVLDLFAGSGGMGLELLSRGARSCTFVEHNRRAANLIRSNCKALGAPRESWHIVTADARAFVTLPQPAGAPFGIVFLDPPYAMEATMISELVQALCDGGHLTPGCVVVYEHADNAPGLEVRGASLLRSRKHGSTSVDLMRIGE
ncbi:MAG: 16S rRNA (guanine(966)-N(2))-methyltransferase RsmD [Atopobiaceae bacterium]|nr:16S rRNA (guanine(966)-N(2))-methyltransferase RsmD [Atopobiaceae bacterium]